MQQEHSHNIHGVNGRLWRVKNTGVRGALCWDAQRWISEARPIAGYGTDAQMTVEIRHDDQCKNGHNSFAITAEVRRPRARDVEACGCLHEDIAQVFPELAPLIRWHLCSTDGPMHYLANTVYWLGYSGWCDDKATSPPNLTHARASAAWPDMPEDFICPEELRAVKAGEIFAPLKDAHLAPVLQQLRGRLPALIADFSADLNRAGLAFNYQGAAA